jgi:hypothetical protein
MCLKGKYEEHWLEYNEALTHQLNRMRQGSPHVFWSIVSAVAVPLIAAIVFIVWLVIHLLATPFKERE